MSYTTSSVPSNHRSLTDKSWCGQGEEYCLSPDCQLNYGSGCDGNQKPDGVDTSDIPRTKVGDVPYGGVGIYDCENSGDIAITFDDGPYEYTDDLLDLLAVRSNHLSKLPLSASRVTLNPLSRNTKLRPPSSLRERTCTRASLMTRNCRGLLLYRHETYSENARCDPDHF